ncbi:hypothetical protein XANCAGTX0491_003874 [Xanthoria calcicola]
MSAQQSLLEAASKNAELLRGLNETESASSSLEQLQAYLDDLDREINVCNTEIQHLEKKTAAELKDHKKYAESITSRFIHRAVGKSEQFAEKASKEEREYVEAVAAENQAKSRLEEWTKKRDEARKQHATLENTNKTHQRLQSELDALYNSIFAGPTPDFPGEDQKESAVREAKEAFDFVKQQHEAEFQAAKCLVDAECFIIKALRWLEKAHDFSRTDMRGCGTFSDMLERNTLSEAQHAMDKVKMLVRQAQRLSPDIPGLGNFDISQGYEMNAIILDDIFGDMARHGRINNCQAQAQKEAQALSVASTKARDRSQQLEQEAADASTRLETARRELQRIRREAFESFEGPPPTYDEAVQHSLASLTI